VARRRFQKGQLCKSEKTCYSKDAAIGHVRRWQVLETVADFPWRREAQGLLDERLRPVNGGASVSIVMFRGCAQLLDREIERRFMGTD